jgi:competence protein ComEA
MQIYLPLEGEEVPTASVSSGASALSDRISINQATATDLERLPGIGPVLAASIIEHRDTSGPFQTEDDLLQVTGIGPSKLDAIRDLILIP